MPTGAPTDVSVSALSESSIVVQWSPPELFEQNGPIDGYQVALVYSNGTQRMYRLGGSTFNFQIEGLCRLIDCNYSYTTPFFGLTAGLPKFANLNITVAARTSIGLGPASAPVPVTTFEDGEWANESGSQVASMIMYSAVPGPPTSVKAAVFDKTSIILTWAPPSNPNGRVLGFQVLYHGYKEQETSRVIEGVADWLKASKIILQVTRQTTEIVILDGPFTIFVPPSQTSYQVDDLQSGLIYSFKVWIQDALCEILHFHADLQVRAKTSPGYGANSTEITVDLSDNVAGNLWTHGGVC